MCFFLLSFVRVHFLFPTRYGLTVMFYLFGKTNNLKFSFQHIGYGCTRFIRRLDNGKAQKNMTISKTILLFQRFYDVFIFVRTIFTTAARHKFKRCSYSIAAKVRIFFLFIFMRISCAEAEFDCSSLPWDEKGFNLCAFRNWIWNFFYLLKEYLNSVIT